MCDDRIHTSCITVLQCFTPGAWCAVALLLSLPPRPCPQVWSSSLSRVTAVEPSTHMTQLGMRLEAARRFAHSKAPLVRGTGWGGAEGGGGWCQVFWCWHGVKSLYQWGLFVGATTVHTPAHGNAAVLSVAFSAFLHALLTSTRALLPSFSYQCDALQSFRRLNLKLTEATAASSSASSAFAHKSFQQLPNCWNDHSCLCRHCI